MDSDHGGSSVDEATTGATIVGVDHHLLSVLTVRQKFLLAMLDIHKPGVKFDQVNPDTKAVWLFVYSRVVKAALPRSDTNALYNGKTPLTKEMLMEKVGVSDEAMILTIVTVKMQEILKEFKSGGDGSNISQVTQPTTGGSIGNNARDSEDASVSDHTRKRKGQGKGGGRKRRNIAPEDPSECLFNPEVGAHQVTYEKFYRRISKSRSSSESITGDANGWYQAVVDRLEEMRSKGEILSQRLQDSSTACVPAMLQEFTSQDNDEQDEIKRPGFKSIDLTVDWPECMLTAV